MAIIAGAVFWSRDNSSTPDVSVLERGVKNLTRESAAEMIETYLKVNLFDTSKNEQFNYYEDGHYVAKNYYVDSSYPELNTDRRAEFKKLDASGFIKIVSEKNSSSYGSVGKDLIFDFTEQAEPYFIKQKNAVPDNKNVYILLAKVLNVEVTGITEPAVTSGVNTRIANYTVKYEPTPIGKIIDEKYAGEELKRQISFVLYDDGWRME